MTRWNTRYRSGTLVGKWHGSAWTPTLQAPPTVEVLAAGGGSAGTMWAFTATGYDGGGGGNTAYNASVPVTAGVTYTITVGGQSSNSVAALGSTVTATGVTGKTGNGNGGTGGVSSATAGTNGTSASTTITGVTRLHGGGGGGGIRYGAGSGGSGGTGGAAGTTNGLGAGGAGVRGGGGGGSADANVWGGGWSGAGGAGEVIIAYPSMYPAASATTGSPTYSNSSRTNYHVYIFTGSGSITF